MPNERFVKPDVVYGEATFDSRDRIGSGTKSVPADQDYIHSTQVKPDNIKTLDLRKVFDPKNIEHDRIQIPQDDDTLNEVEITIGKHSPDRGRGS